MRDDLLKSSSDFSIRLIELVRYLKDEGREFPLSERLLTCGNGIGVNLRLAALLNGKERTEKSMQAFTFAVESEYMLKLMVKTGYLAERQSEIILKDCSGLRELIAAAEKEDGHIKMHS